jgi:hypothetical protein
VCHLEEKLVAKMSGEVGHLANYMNKTNFRDEYYVVWGGFSSGGTGGNPIFKNIHSPQTEAGNFETTHSERNCYSCHNPHGSDNPAMTNYTERYDGKIFNYTYITDVAYPNDNTWTVLDYANWKSAANKGGGLYLTGSDPQACGCHSPTWASLQDDYFAYREYIDYEPAGGAGCLECLVSSATTAAALV